MEDSIARVHARRQNLLTLNGEVPHNMPREVKVNVARSLHATVTLEGAPVLHTSAWMDYLSPILPIYFCVGPL